MKGRCKTKFSLGIVLIDNHARMVYVFAKTNIFFARMVYIFKKLTFCSNNYFYIFPWCSLEIQTLVLRHNSTLWPHVSVVRKPLKKWYTSSALGTVCGWPTSPPSPWYEKKKSFKNRINMIWNLSHVHLSKIEKQKYFKLKN